MNIATLVTSQRSTSRYLLFDNQQQLAGWQNCKTDEIRWVRQPRTDYKKMAFSGIAIVQPHILDLLPSATHPYPIIPAYLEIAKDHSIRYFEHPSEAWLDVGKPETLRLAQSWRINP